MLIIALLIAIAILVLAWSLLRVSARAEEEQRKQVEEYFRWVG
jgi:Tfp pilus assembly protein PilO